ncbi:ATP-binding protein [Neorhizobium galegae]|uniref:ATP-binding protein n=1 Tax=Neorhizobium galegae TaxID=399 RepID=UPI002105EFCA|nr:ATP-binding protein [Neorhizobium galegae]
MLMFFRRLPGLSTIHSQITGIILLGLTIIVLGGSFLEQRVGNGYSMVDVEELADSVFTIASILKTATPEERDIVLRAANRAGWDLNLRPRALAETFKSSSPQESVLDATIDWLFSPDGKQTPLGGWQTFVDDKRVVSAEVDDKTILVLGGLPSTAFWSEVLIRGPHYLVALITLIVLFSSFGVWAITRPLRKIASAAANADITSGRVIFEEEGSVEIVAVARSLNGMSDRITDMIQSRTRMLRGVSHDLRTPLTRLRLRVERVGDGQLRDMLLADISRIDSLLKESLSYLRDDHHREQVETIDLATTLQTICSEFDDVGHKINYIGPNHLSANCKPLAITRAVTNLCENAVKFGDRAAIELKRSGDKVVVDVSDNGPGIPKQSRAQVLEPFFKLNAARTDGNAGFGLGLSIVAEIVQAHRGTLELLDGEPSGLLARLTFPADLPADGVAAQFR